MKSTHSVFYKNSRQMGEIPSGSINLVVTSPPYPMIEMWDEMFSSTDSKIKQALLDSNGAKAHFLMNKCLNEVWREVDRVLAPSGIVCINVGDATRKIGDTFQLFSNHTFITNFFIELGYQPLPLILWRKQSNKPNKFMGSGMVPTNAYVTLEHEYILIFRKVGNRKFQDDKPSRNSSAYFWEERNVWFSDVWDLNGESQKINNKGTRQRSAAYPFELAYRLINMYSIQGDTILDPFLGTGTTMIAAIASCRNSIGYEICPELKNIIESRLHDVVDFSNRVIENRINKHIQFIISKDSTKYKSAHYDFNVITSQEELIFIPRLKTISMLYENTYSVNYSDNAFIKHVNSDKKTIKLEL